MRSASSSLHRFRLPTIHSSLPTGSWQRSPRSPTAQVLPLTPPFDFTPTIQAAQRNAAILAGADFDLGKIIDAHSTTTLGYGSEFRPVDQLRTILGRHPNFKVLEGIVSKGMSSIFQREISREEQRATTATMISRGNHKSAQIETTEVTWLLAKDVLHGFSIPLPISSILSIPNAGVQPLGLVSQWTVGADGKRVRKHRITQDLTFCCNDNGSPNLINRRIDMSAYTEMIYGWCLPRILHFISALRARHPDKVILISKYDYSDAYRRIAHSAASAVQTIAVVPPLAYLSLRLTFGGAPNPPTWCMFSEMVTDLANEISLCDDWDETTVFSPAQPTVPTPVRLADDIPFGQALD